MSRVLKAPFEIRKKIFKKTHQAVKKFAKTTVGKIVIMLVAAYFTAGMAYGFGAVNAGIAGTFTGTAAAAGGVTAFEGAVAAGELTAAATAGGELAAGVVAAETLAEGAAYTAAAETAGWTMSETGLLVAAEDAAAAAAASEAALAVEGAELLAGGEAMAGAAGEVAAEGAAGLAEGAGAEAPAAATAPGAASAPEAVATAGTPPAPLEVPTAATTPAPIETPAGLTQPTGAENVVSQGASPAAQAQATGNTGWANGGGFGSGGLDPNTMGGAGGMHAAPVGEAAVSQSLLESTRAWFNSLSASEKLVVGQVVGGMGKGAFGAIRESIADKARADEIAKKRANARVPDLTSLFPGYQRPGLVQSEMGGGR